MIWKKMNHQQKTLYFVFCAVLSFISALLLSQNSYAIDYTFYQNNPTSYFCHSSRLEGTNLQNQCWNLTTPQTVINAGNGRFVYGFALAQISTTGHTYSTYTTMYFDININMTSNDFNYYPGNATRVLVVTMQDGTTKRADCNFSFHNDQGYTRFECSATLPQNAKPSYMAFRLGEVTLPENPIGLLDIHSKPLTINFSGWGYVTSSSEESGYLSQITNQNQTIINQNQTIINQNTQQAEQDQQDRDDISNTSEQAEQAGESAGESAEETGTTLFAAFSALLGALTNVQQTNCNLVMPEINMQGTDIDFGTLNLCQNEVPNSLKTLGSLMLVFLIVPMGINLAKRMIALYNELLGGN